MPNHAAHQQQPPISLYHLGARGPTAEEETQFKAVLGEAVEQAARLLVAELSASGGGSLDVLCEHFAACTLELPHKTYIYALLLASVHEQSEAVAHRLLSALHARLDAAMADTSSGLGWRALKMTVRLYAELIKLGVCPTSVLSDAYTSFVHVLADPSSSEERKDCAALMLLSTLPWAAGALPVDGGVADAPGMDLAQVFTAVRQYVQVERQLRQQAAAACTPFRTNCPYEQRDELTLLLDQVQDLAGSGWKTPLIPTAADFATPYTKVLSPGEKIAFPKNSPTIAYPLPIVHFELLTDAVVTKRMPFKADLPVPSSIDHFVARDIFQDLIFHFDHNHTEFTRLFFDTAILPPSSPYNPIQLLIELLFANMLRLPQPEQKFVYYGVLIVDMCTARPKEVAPVLGKVIYTVFERVQDLDVECQFRFTTWFAHHLSNFDYKWKWAAWSSTKTEPKDTAQSLLIQETLEKCVRLSYFERVTRVFATDPSGASDMTSLMPPQPQPCFKYDSMDKARKRAENDRIASGGAQGTSASNVDVEMDAMDASSYEQDPRLVAFADRFLECLRLKQPLHELQAVVTEMAAYAGTLGGTLKHGDEPLDGMPLAREITVQCVLFLGSKSFSHTLNVMERHLALLKWVAPTPEAKLHLLQVVASFWQTNKQFLMIVVDKMVNYRVVEPSVVVNWVFSMDGGVPDFHRSYVWTMLKSTIAKVNARVRGVTRKLQIARVADADGDEKMGSPVKPGAEDTPTEPLPLTGQASKTATLTAELEELEREKKQLFIDVFTKLLDLLVPAVGDSEKEESAFFRYGEGMLHELGRCFHAELKPITTTLDMLVFQPRGMHIDKSVGLLNLNLGGRPGNSN